MRSDALLDQIVIELLVPRTLTGRELAAVRRALIHPSFLPRLRRALRPLFVAHPTLAAVRLRVGR